MLDMETWTMISAIYYGSDNGASELMPHTYKKRLGLDLMIMICYGTPFSITTNSMLLQFLSDASTIAI